MKETIMLLKVDLQCPCCYTKIKKILCKFPEIRDQVYDDKGNKVKITVLSCNPEKIRDKLLCKGAKVITSIEIIEPPKEDTKPPSKEQNPKQPKNPTEKCDSQKVKPERNPEFQIHCRVRTCCGQCNEGHGGGPCRRDCHISSCEYCYVSEKCKGPGKQKKPEKPAEPEKPVVEKCKEPPKTEPPKIPVPAHVFLPFCPVRTHCWQCYEGHGGGPCDHGYGVPPPPCYDGYGHGRGVPLPPCYDGYGYGRDCHMNRCDYYLSEDSSCSIM